jgi:MYXO-CTERM domain-containing protein
VCDAETGECIADPCINKVCETGQVCDPSAGGCVDDRCRNIQCPSGEFCKLGECYAPGLPRPDAGSGHIDAGPESVLAAGGFGCAASGTGSRGGLAGIVLMALVVALAVRRRRSAGVAALALTATVAVSGCEVDPFCLDRCGETVDGGIDGGQFFDGGVARDGGVIRYDACAPGAVDECNEADDDCDGYVDEDIDLSTDGRHCGACGVNCARTGAQTECRDGVCTFVACFDGFVDLNGDTTGPFADTDGCEYRCFPSNGGVEACDTIDNDCDGEVDEDFDFSSDENHCGRCGQVCTFFRVSTATCESGVCTFDPATGCVPGYVDANGIQSDGCEVECTPSPSGVEECNGLDDDCNGVVDDGFDLDTDVTNCGRCGRVCSFPHATPRCSAGTCSFDPATDCEPGYSDRDGVQLNGCEYPCTPTADPTEICDGIDNDCDGRVDGVTADAGGSCNAAPGGVATGACTDTGVLTCVGGRLICAGAPEPTVERCNGIDDDCDGVVDDSPVDVGRVCLPAVGACTAGFNVCRDGTLVCEREVGPAPEICNGLDDDCNGVADDALTDPGIGTTCGTDVGECRSGTLSCTEGRLVCEGSVGGSPELCNGLDDDCDGLVDDDPIDEGGPCGSSVGQCVPGSETCVEGRLVCMGGAGPSMEECDGQDDDCDGAVDEGLTRICYSGSPTTRGVGVCRDGVQACFGGTFGTCAGEVLPSPETCDNEDDDCDGSTDEDVTAPCYSGPPATEGVGLCRGGVQTCAGGEFGACVGQVLPTSETCDGQDEDCDGVVDEGPGGGPLTQTCYAGPPGTAGVGTCVAGTQICRFGAYGVCTGEVTPRAEYCGDMLDTDCDGLDDVAEGCFTAGGELRLDTTTGAGAAHAFDLRIATSPLASNVYAVWVDKSAGSDASDIYFSRSTDGGQTWSAPTNLTSSVSDRAVRPEIAVGRTTGGSPQDVIHVAYQLVPAGDEDASERVRRVYVRSSTNSGTSFTSQTLLSGTTTDNFKHSIATNATGSRVVVAWERLNTSSLARHVVARVSTNSGSSWSNERVVSRNVGAIPMAGEPVVAVTSSGRFVFVWREARPPARETFDIYATYADDLSSDIPATREIRLDGDTAQTRASDSLRIVSDGNRLYVVWVDVSTTTGGGADIVFVRSTDNALTWSSERILDDPGMTLSDSSEPTIAIDPRTSSATDDRIFVAWTDTRDGSQIYFTSSLDSGSSFTAPVRASQQGGGPVPGISESPRIAFAGGDGVVIAYVNDANGSASRTRVRAAMSIDAGLTWLITDPVLDGGGGDAADPAIARVSGSGLTNGAVVGWIDYRSGTRINGDVYRVRVGR